MYMATHCVRSLPRTIRSSHLWVAAFLIAVGCGGEAALPLHKSPERVGLFPIFTRGQWGVIDKDGEMLIEPQFDCIGSFQQGLAEVWLDEKVGFMNASGSIVAFPQFDWMGDFNDGLAPVSLGGAYSFVDESGKLVTKSSFNALFSLSEGLAVAKQSDQWGYVDRTGNWVIAPKFKSARTFHEQRGAVALEVGNGEKWSFVNPAGELIAPPQWDFVSDFEDGRARVQLADRYGIIDRDANYVVNPQFEHIYDFRERRAAVSRGDRIGFIDEEGAVVIPPQVDSVVHWFEGPRWACQRHAWDGGGRSGFSEGLVIVGIDGRIGAMDRAGNFVIPPTYEEMSPFVEGYAVARVEGKYGYVNPSGSWVIPSQFESAAPFAEKRARAAMGGKWGYIDTRGDWIVKPSFDDAASFFDGHAYIRVKDDLGLIDRSGEFVFGPTPMYEEAPPEIEAALEAAFEESGWTYAAIPSYDRQFLFDGSIAPHSLSGDFDCDGKADYAVRVDADEESTIVVFLARDSFNRPWSLGWGAFLKLATNEEGRKMDEDVVCDSIFTGPFESHGWWWTWDLGRQRFRKVST